MDLSLAPYHWAVTLLGGSQNGRRRLLNLVNLAVQAIAATLVFPLVLALSGGRWGENNSMLYYFVIGPPFFFVLLVALQALVVPITALVNWLLANELEDERRWTYLILSWIAAFGLAILHSILLCFLD